MSTSAHYHPELYPALNPSGWRVPGSVLLISCYELGRPPSGLTWPAAVLRRSGYEPDLLDLSLQQLDAEKLDRARLVAFSVPMHTALRLGVEAARSARLQNPGCYICFFGLYAWLNAEFLLGSGIADSVIGGEYEEPLAALVASLEQGDPAPEYVSRPGRLRAPCLERSRLPVPEHDLLPPLSGYARLLDRGETRLAGYVEATRGCLRMCLHCPVVPVYQGRLFVVPRELVMEDIRRQVAAGAGHITFGDPDFLNGPGHSLRIVREMHRLFPRLTFDFTAKIDHIVRHSRIFPEMRDLGCLFVTTAMESLSDRVLRNLEKGHDREAAVRAIEIARGSGIALRPTWVAFTPWTSLQDYVEMLEFIRDQGLARQVDPVQYTVRLLVPPGSALLRSDAMRPHLDGLDAASFIHRWTHPDPGMELLYHSVVSLVNASVRGGEEIEKTFWKVRRMAWEALEPARAGLLDCDRLPGEINPPRLTESWFC